MDVLFRSVSSAKLSARNKPKLQHQECKAGLKGGMEWLFPRLKRENSEKQKVNTRPPKKKTRNEAPASPPNQKLISQALHFLSFDSSAPVGCEQ